MRTRVFTTKNGWLKFCFQDQNELNKEIGMILSIGFIVGVLGSLGVVRILDVTKKLKLIISVNTCLCLIFCILFTALSSEFKPIFHLPLNLQ